MDHRLTVLETRSDTILPTLLTPDEFYRGRADQRADTAAQLDKFRADTATQLDKFRADINAHLDKLRADTTAQIDRFRADTTAQFDTLRTEMHALRAEVNATVFGAMRWMIGLTITLIVAISGFGLALFHTTRTMSAQYERHTVAAPAAPSAPIAPPAQQR